MVSMCSYCFADHDKEREENPNFKCKWIIDGERRAEAYERFLKSWGYVPVDEDQA